MEDQELVVFQIISAVGTARSSYIEAIQAAKAGDYSAANELISEGDKVFKEGHKFHRQLVKNEASGHKTEVSILLIHAEDQLMSAEGFKIIAEEFIEVYRKMDDMAKA